MPAPCCVCCPQPSPGPEPCRPEIYVSRLSLAATTPRTEGPATEPFGLSPLAWMRLDGDISLPGRPALAATARLIGTPIPSAHDDQGALSRASAFDYLVSRGCLAHPTRGATIDFDVAMAPLPPRSLISSKLERARAPRTLIRVHGQHLPAPPPSREVRRFLLTTLLCLSGSQT